MNLKDELDAVFYNAPVLVTGGCGFIGSHLVEKLVQLGARVSVLDNLRAGHVANLKQVMPEMHLIEGDVRDAESVESALRRVRPRVVFHLAANASVPGSVTEPAYDFEANCAGTFVLLHGLMHALDGCEKVVFASSGAVYGQPDHFPIAETDLLQPISPYGASKLAAEVQARMFHQVYHLPVTIARLFNCYGPRMARFVILDFLRKLQQNPDCLEILGTGQQIRDFIYVADTVQGLLLLAARGESGEAYNLSSGKTCSVTELAHSLIAALELQDRTQITYTGKSWVGDAQRWEVSLEKLNALGYHSEVSLAEGLARTIAWFQSEGITK